MKLNKLFLTLILLVGALVLVSSAYTLSDPRLTHGGTGSAFSGDVTDTSFDSEMCQQGQDFIVQVAPFGCEPAVVRSDLLEEQDVPVFCKLQAVKINPFIDITAIDSINIRGEYPRGVRSVGFTPSYSALGENRKLNNLQWDEIGYATIVLRQNPNESSMPDFVQGNLSAKITYDLKNAFGLRKHTFYLPVLEDNEFDRSLGQYAFFNKMGYLRAEDIAEDSASVAIYSGRYEAPFGNSRQGEIDRQRIGRYDLQVGQSTNKIYLPGFDCFSAVQFRLEDIEFQDTRVRLNANSQIYEVKEGERFLDGKCYVRDIEKTGLNQIIKMTCEEDEGTETFDLRISPKIKLDIGGVEEEYEVGDYLYETNLGKYVYLGYVGSNSYEAKDLVAYLVIADEKMARLGPSEILAAGKLGEVNPNPENIRESLRYVPGYSAKLWNWLFEGNGFERLEYMDELEVGGKIIELMGFGSEEDFPITAQIEDYYDNALEDYEYVFSNYQGENYPEGDELTLGEKSLYAKMLLAKDISQKKDLKFFCEEFESSFPDSELDISFCENLLFLSNEGVSTRDSIIEGDLQRISFEGVYEPSFEDYGVELYVRPRGEEIQSYNLRKNQILYLDDEGREYVQLISIRDKDTVTLKTNIEKTGLARAQDVLVSENRLLRKDVSETFNSNYTFTVHEINFKRVAKVSVEPSINYAGSDIDFNFAVGIEKRGIQLSPEKTQSIIEDLNDTIETWEDISSTLGDTIDVFQDACLAVGGVLTLKNLLFNSGGESFARQEVMSGTDGWYERCADLIQEGEYRTEEECLQDNSDEIDSEVNLLAEMLKEQNNEIKDIQDQEGVSQEQGILGTKVVDTTKLVEEYLPRVRNALERRGEFIENPRTGEVISVSSLFEILTPEGWENNLFSIDLLKEIELYASVLNEKSLSGSQEESYESKLYVAVNQLEINSEKYRDIRNWATSVGTDSNKIDFIEIGGNAQELAYDGLVLEDLEVVISGNNITEDTPVKLLQGSNGRKYILALDDSSGTDRLTILVDDDFNQYVFDGNGNRLSRSDIPNEVQNVFFKKYDSSSYRNDYKNPEIKYYETEPYKGLPAVVPFDTNEGWYAYIEQSIDFFGEQRAYDQSARVNSFWLCNVGNNGLEEFSQGNTGDDICQLINLGTGQPYNQFTGLEESESARLIDRAVNAIEYASRGYRDGVRVVKIGDETIEVGSPAISSSLSKCEDYMSPKDCNVLFNVCDPVICPSSRCDFGGQYPVQDVIQSGIIGSLSLCLPNYNEGIYVPICLTGVKAGLDGFLSVLRSYESCLQESLDTGRTIGVCEQINSIYLCEFFWRQALPLAELTLPKIVNAVTGENTRGGGEYSNLNAAWDNAKNSVNFFTEFYLADSSKSFKARSQEEIGSEVCNSFISVDYPTGQGVFSTLTRRTSPPQYTGNFDAIPFTTTTVPPVSQYTVNYRIYSGEDRGAYYKVYLRGGSGSSYYQDTFSGRIVASGYVPVGETIAEKKDFTAPEGYQELCIAVNDEEECDFKQVSTSFAFDYIKDQARQSQIENTNIKSQSECVSGSANVYGLLNLNAQEGISNAVNPEIYNQGITRICSTDNPGAGSDPYLGSEDQRWIDVGYCGDSNIRCWIDTESIDRALEFQASANESLKELSERANENIQNENGYLNPQEFDLAVENLSNEDNREKKFEMIQNLLDKVYLNSHKGYLYYLRGQIYDGLVREWFGKLENRIEKGEIEEGIFYRDETKTVEDIVTEDGFESVVFEFNDARASTRLGSNKPNVCYKYFNQSWHWTLYCGEIGNYDIRARKDIEWINVGTLINPYSGAELTDNSKKFIPKLQDKNYFEGIDLLMKRAKINKEGGIVNSIGFANTFISVGEENSIFYDHLGRFSILSDSQNMRMYLRYLEKNWVYTFTDYTRLDSPSWKTVNLLPLDRELSDNEKLLLNSLEDKNLVEGAAIIFGDVSTKDIQATFVPTGWTCEGILNQIDTLEGTYNSNIKVYGFIEGLYEQGFLEEEEYNEMKGIDEFNQPREMAAPDVSYLRTILDDCETKDSTDFGISSGETCPIPESPSETVLSIDNAENRVIQTLDDLEGHYAKIGGAGCYSSIKYVYDKAGVTHSCVYSDSIGREYDIGSYVAQMDSKPKCSGVKYCVNDQPTESCSLNREKGENLNTFDKLGDIEPGDILSYVYSSSSGHNVIFVEWADADILKARVFDWNGERIEPGKTNEFGEVCEGEWIKEYSNGDRYCKTYRYTEVILQDDEHPVYMYWEPVIVGRSTSVSEIEIPTSGLVENVEEKKSIEYNIDLAIEKAESLKEENANYKTNLNFMDALLERGLINRVEYYKYSGRWGGYTLKIDEVINLLNDIKNEEERIDSLEDISMAGLSGTEEKLIKEAQSCDECGSGTFNTCNEQECFLLGIALEKDCQYESGFLGGSCI